MGGHLDICDRTVDSPMLASSTGHDCLTMNLESQMLILAVMKCSLWSVDTLMPIAPLLCPSLIEDSASIQRCTFFDTPQMTLVGQKN